MRYLENGDVSPGRPTRTGTRNANRSPRVSQKRTVSGALPRSLIPTNHERNEVISTNTELPHRAEELAIPTGDGLRLLVRPVPASGDRTIVGIAPQWQDRLGTWKLSHSGLMLTPAAARALAPVLLAMAATIEPELIDPAPTEADRCSSRWP